MNAAVRRSAAGLRLGAASMCLAVLMTGCRPSPPPPEDVLRHVSERGPLKLTVEVRPKQVWVGDPLTIAVQLHAPDDYAVELPTAADLGKLTVEGVESPDPRPAAEGGLDWRRQFRLVSYESGGLEIPPLVVKYARRTAADSQPALDSELASDTLKIEVRSALTTQDSPERPRDITGTLMPVPTLRDSVLRVLLVAAVGAGGVAVLLAAWLAWRRWRRRELPPVLPEVWALQSLAELERQEWLTGGRAREFYYRLSEIVRSYIEKKFALAAPEMTTEEFLGSLARDRTTLPYDADRLRVFLEACDLVKYAALMPQRDDAETILAAARTFVYETAAAAERAAQLARQQQAGSHGVLREEEAAA
jgi:hypothetical protein